MDLHGERGFRILWYYPRPHSGPDPVIELIVASGHEVIVQSQRSFKGSILPSAGFGYEQIPELPEVGYLRGLQVGVVARRFQILQRQIMKVYRILRINPDIVYFYHLEPELDWLTCRLIRLLSKVRIVGVVHDVRPHVSRFRPRLEKFVWKLGYNQNCVHHLVVFHDILRDQLIDEFDVDPARISTVPIMVAQPETPNRRCHRGPFQVLVLGTLREDKGLEQLISAICAAPVSTDVRYVIAGSGPAHLENLAEDLATCRSDVSVELGIYTAEREKELLTTSDLLVLPYTTFHSQSGILADGYRYGLPLLVTDVGAMGPTVRRDGTGWVVPPGDAVALRNALDHIATVHGDYYQKQAAIVRASARHAPATVAKGLNEAFSRCIIDR